MSTEQKIQCKKSTIIIGLMGFVFNLMIVLPSMIQERGYSYSNYLENLEHGYSTAFRYVETKLYTTMIIFTAFCCAVYLLQVILNRVRSLNILIPAATLASLLYITYVFSDNAVDNISILYRAVPVMAFCLVLSLIGIITKKPVFAVIAGFVAIALVVVLYPLESNSHYLFPFGNTFASNVMLFFALLKKSEKKVASPAPSASTKAPEKIRASEPVTVSVSEISNTIGDDIFSCGVIIIDEKITAATKDFKIYNEQGSVIGTVKETISGGAKASRVLLGKKTAVLQSVQLYVYDSNDTPLLGASKKGIFGSVTDANGNIICTLKKGILLDPNGNALCKLRSTLKSGTIVETPDGKVVAEIKEKWLTAKSLLTTSDTYSITFSPDTSKEMRVLAIGTALIIEMITGNV